MKMSTRGQYALEIAVDLALHLMPDRLESLNDIAKRRNLSEKYLERIMKLLKEAGLVKSVRGAYGGYCLTKEPGEISVLEVLRAAEGQLAPVSCLVENTECGMECEICSTKSTWGEMWEQILDTAAEVTVADIAEIVRKKRPVKKSAGGRFYCLTVLFLLWFQAVFGVAVFIFWIK